MTIPHFTGQFTMSNYFSLDGSNQNLALLGASTKLSDNLSITAGVGNSWEIDKDGHSKNQPAIELKGKYNISDNLNVQARFREIGGKDQYRVTFGGSHVFDKKNSIYAAAHLTTNDFNKYKTGGWIGYTHKFNNGVSISAEIQQNLNKETSQNLGKTLGCFNDNNKLANIIVSIPLTK